MGLRATCSFKGLFASSSQLELLRGKNCRLLLPGPATHNTPSPPPRLSLRTVCTTLPGKAGEDRQPPPCIRSHTADTDLRAPLAATLFPPQQSLATGALQLGQLPAAPTPHPQRRVPVLALPTSSVVISKVREGRVPGNWPWTLA